MIDKINVLIVGLGNMGIPHSLAYHHNDNFNRVGLCSRNATSINDLPDELTEYPRFDDYQQALKICNPHAVCICTWPDTHKEFAIKPLRLEHTFSLKNQSRKLWLNPKKL